MIGPAETLAGYLVRQRTPVLRYVTRLLGSDHHLAEDITQEALLRAWSHADRLEWRDRSILPWLLRIARNLVVDAWRKDRAIPVGIGADAFNDRAELGDLAETVADRHLLVDALTRLAPVHREILVQVHLLGRAGDQVAQDLRIPRGTVKSRTHNAVRTLRAELGIVAPGTGEAA